jgi:hypothetical protein
MSEKQFFLSSGGIGSSYGVNSKKKVLKVEKLHPAMQSVLN